MSTSGLTMTEDQAIQHLIKIIERDFKKYRRTYSAHNSTHLTPRVISEVSTYFEERECTVTGVEDSPVMQNVNLFPYLDGGVNSLEPNFKQVTQPKEYFVVSKKKEAVVVG